MKTGDWIMGGKGDECVTMKRNEKVNYLIKFHQQ